MKCLVPSGDVYGEEIVWSPEYRFLYWIDINRFLILGHDLVAGTTTSWFFDTPLTALSLSSEPGRLLFELGSHLEWWWPATDRRQPHGFRFNGRPELRVNDGRADPLGNFGPVQ